MPSVCADGIFCFMNPSPHDASRNVTMLEVVCAVIRNEAGEVLACKRPQGKHLEGLWEFPGGKIEKDESPILALRREIREELGVELILSNPLTPVVWDYPQRRIRLHPYLCEIASGVPAPIEHEELRWCRPEAFRSLVWADADYPIWLELERLAAGDGKS